MLCYRLEQLLYSLIRNKTTEFPLLYNIIAPRYCQAKICIIVCITFMELKF